MEGLRTVMVGGGPGCREGAGLLSSMVRLRLLKELFLWRDILALLSSRLRDCCWTT